MKAITHFSLSKPKLVYLIMTVLVIISVGMLPSIIVDTDPESMLPEHDQHRLFHDQIKRQFSMHDMIVVGTISHQTTSIYTPKKLAELTLLVKQISQIPQVISPEILSLNTTDNISQDKHGSIQFTWLMQAAPKTIQQSEQIKKAVNKLPLLANTLVSNDGKAATIYVPIRSKKHSFEVATKIKKIIKSLQSHDEYHITGLPVAEDQFGIEMFVQMAISAPIAGLVIFVLLWFFFRSLELIIAPMVVALATVIISMGLLIGMGFTVHIMSSMIAIFLMPIAVVDSTHILSEFADEYKKGQSPKLIIKRVISRLFTPMLYTSLTSAIGFASLMLTPIPPVKVFGGFIAFGILLAFILTIVFIPAYISRMSDTSLKQLQQSMHNASTGSLIRWLPKLGRFAINHNKLVLTVFAISAVLSIFGINKIQVNDNPINWFNSKHEIRIADKKLNQHFAGTHDAWLVLSKEEPNNIQEQIQYFIELINAEKLNNHDLLLLLQRLEQQANSDWQQQTIDHLDDLLFNATDHTQAIERLITTLEAQQQKQKVFQSPELLNWMDSFSEYLVSSGLVGKVNALPDIIKTVNRELNGGESGDYRLPSSSQAIAQTLLQFQSSHRPTDLWHFVTPDYQRSLMWLQLTNGDNQHMSDVIDLVSEYITRHPLPAGVTVNWAGKTYLNVIWQQQMVSGMFDSLLSSFAIVFLMMALLFRSIKYGLLAMLPLTLTISMIYGLIGWFGKYYDMPIAVLSALTLGLSVDFAIHFIERFRDSVRRGQPYLTALLSLFDEPARAISRNAIIVAVGFTPLLLSPLVPYVTVGFFLASIMTISALVTLILLPALISLKPRS
ncbi:MAG: efflux RND transporter permease subunit [Parashewanella sp.]